VATGRRRPPRLPVLISPAVWGEEVERLAKSSPARVAAARERAGLDRDEIALTHLSRCEPEGADGTRLGRLVKTYVPIDAGPASVRPFGFVFWPEHGEQGACLELLAYGERHPRKGTRSVYERAHERLHSRYRIRKSAGRRGARVSRRASRRDLQAACSAASRTVAGSSGAPAGTAPRDEPPLCRRTPRRPARAAPGSCSPCDEQRPDHPRRRYQT